MGSFHPNRIIGPVEELNIFQVDTESEVDVHISIVKDPKTVFWVNEGTNTFPNLRLLSEKENPDIEAPEKENLPGWKKFHASEDTLTQSHQSASATGTVSKMKFRKFGQLFHTVKRSRAGQTRTDRKSLVACSATQED